MKILVTGANGYLGYGIVKQLLNDGLDVIATDLSVTHIDNRAKCLECNIFHIDDPYEYFENPDVVLHLAWRDGFVHNSDNHVLDLPLHFLFLKRLIDSGVNRVAVLGSMHEIGFFEGAINEDTPCKPMNLYGIAKNSLRDMIDLVSGQRKTQFQWLRGYYIVSNLQFGNSFFSKIVNAEKEGKDKFPFTSGENQYDFLDYEDFCYQIAAAVEQDEILGIINICSGKPEKLADRVERFIRENHYKIKLGYGEFPDRAYDSKAVWGNDKKIRQIICSKKRDSLTQGILYES